MVRAAARSTSVWSLSVRLSLLSHSPTCRDRGVGAGGRRHVSAKACPATVLARYARRRLRPFRTARTTGSTPAQLACMLRFGSRAQRSAPDDAWRMICNRAAHGKQNCRGRKARCVRREVDASSQEPLAFEDRARAQEPTITMKKKPRRSGPADSLPARRCATEHHIRQRSAQLTHSRHICLDGSRCLATRTAAAGSSTRPRFVTLACIFLSL